MESTKEERNANRAIQMALMHIIKDNGSDGYVVEMLNQKQEKVLMMIQLHEDGELEVFGPFTNEKLHQVMPNEKPFLMEEGFFQFGK